MPKFKRLGVVVGVIGLACGSAISGAGVTHADSAMTQLMSVLPHGFDSSNCDESSHPIPAAMATVDCGQNSASTAPHAATFGLFPDVESLNSEFNYWVDTNDEVLDCPDGTASPGGWHYEETPDSTAGQFVCGTLNGNADVFWTEDAELLIGDIHGPDLEALYDFWLSPHGG